MAPLLGKRKRPQAQTKSTATPRKTSKPISRASIDESESEGSRSQSPELNGKGDGDAILQDIFRRHFEQRFNPLPVEEKKQDSEAGEESEEDEELEGGDEWIGFSGDDGEEEKALSTRVVEVVDHGKPSSTGFDLDRKSALKAFMSTKPPSVAKPSSLSKTKAVTDGTPDTADESLNLKNDIDLQRLLSESHLLSSQPQNGTSAKSLEHTSKSRLKALDLRLQSLGAKGSMYAHTNVPMAVRKGAISAKEGKEAARRREAKENGIVLEAQTKKGGGKGGDSRDGRDRARERDRGVGAPAVGKMRGGMLTLSKRDVASIEGPRRGGRSRGRGRGRGGRR